MAQPIFKPTWAIYEKDSHDQNDANKAIKASDMFLAEREKEIKTSRKAKLWEEDRKKSIYKEKPKYTKRRIKAEQERITAPLKKLKQLGSFDQSIKPAPGFIIVEIEEIVTKTQSGIILTEADKEPNTGIVVEVSDDLFIHGQYIKCPVKIGDKVLFKRMAGQMGSPGAELTINDKPFRLMRWNPLPMDSDILGVFHE